MFRKPNQPVAIALTDRHMTAGDEAACVREASGS